MIHKLSEQEDITVQKFLFSGRHKLNEQKIVAQILFLNPKNSANLPKIPQIFGSLKN
jgi:hypothetical protein